MSIEEKILKMRREYSGEPLDESSVDPDPVHQFEKWFEDAVKAEVVDPHAMVIATATRMGKPTARVVLLRGLDQNGLIFYTGYISRKGIEVLSNPIAAAVFFWRELDRQIRVEGLIEKVSDAESDKYFQSRPRENQIATWASSQSQVVVRANQFKTSREKLDALFKEFEKKFAGKPVLRPANWGGFRLKPSSYEFWQGKPGRLHDRVLYSTNENGGWQIDRLAP